MALLLLAAGFAYVMMVMHRQGQLEADKWTSLFSGNLWTNYILPAPWKVLTLILVPHALTAMMPSLISHFVVILKDTALGYIISYPELLAVARRFGSGEGNILQMLLLAAPHLRGHQLRPNPLRRVAG